MRQIGEIRWTHGAVGGGKRVTVTMMFVGEEVVSVLDRITIPFLQ